MNQGQRKDVFLTEADTLEEIGAKLTGAMRYVSQLRGPVMIWWKGEPYTMLVPPDAGLAWSRAEESRRLSRIATESAGLGHAVHHEPDEGPE